MMDAELFQTHRPALLALGYRMLGDLARAEDAVQEAYLRWQRREEKRDVESPKAFLLTTVARLCLDELDSARARREESRSDRLPEPVDLGESGLSRVETMDQISMAFLVLLQRLTPAERAVLLLHDVFDLSHLECAATLGKTEAACRQLLSRARENVAAGKRVLEAPRDEHRRLLLAFVRAVNEGRHEELLELLAEDALLIADAGPGGGRYGKIRNVGKPLAGRQRIVTLMKAFAAQDVSPRLTIQERTLNGHPAVIALQGEEVVAAILISVADGKIQHVFLQNDRTRLRHVGAG
jgi:RNA polymerase sigma-70 factor, ECF subfamily